MVESVIRLYRSSFSVTVDSKAFSWHDPVWRIPVLLCPMNEEAKGSGLLCRSISMAVSRSGTPVLVNPQRGGAPSSYAIMCGCRRCIWGTAPCILIQLCNVHYTIMCGCRRCIWGTAPCILIQLCNVHYIIVQHRFLIIKPTRCTNFSNLFLEWDSTCFGQFLCTSSGVFHCTHRIRMELCSILILLASCQQICMTYTIAVCTVKNSWWCTEELSETCRVSFRE